MFDYFRRLDERDQLGRRISFLSYSWCASVAGRVMVVALWSWAPKLRPLDPRRFPLWSGRCYVVPFLRMLCGVVFCRRLRSWLLPVDALRRRSWRRSVTAFRSRKVWALPLGSSRTKSWATSCRRRDVFFSFCACSSLFCLARVRSSFVHKRASEIALDWIRSDRSLAEYGDCSLLVGRFVDNVDWECRVRGFKPLDDRAKARCLLPVFVVVSLVCRCFCGTLFAWCRFS